MDYVNFDAAALSVADLAAIIKHHDQLYWQSGTPEIPDYRYDQLVNALKKLAPDHELVNAIHTPQVSGSGTVHYQVPLLSLDKAYSLDEVIEWAGKYKRSDDELLLIEPKYDGISANFAGGVLSTRGDGYDGEIITDKLPLIELESPGYSGPVNRPTRGEIIMRLDRFNRFQESIRSKGKSKYKNTRNLLTGLMTLKDERDLAQVQYVMRQTGTFLTLVDYDLKSYPVLLNNLRAEWDDLLKTFEELPYPQDGVVIKLADLAYRDSLGNTAHHPRGEIAYKFQNAQAQSTLLNVIWSFGKNCLTPVAEIEPVAIGGITIKHATLHNVQNIIDREIQIGDQIVIERAEHVIPYIKESTPGAVRRSALIANCPGCGAKLEQIGPELCCSNPDCLETRLQNLVASVKNIGIERLGEPVLRKMMSILQVRTLTDIFKLTKADLLKLASFGDKSADNLLQELRKAQSVNDFQVLAALNIPHVGLNMAKVILQAHNFAELRQMTEEQLAEIRGVGPERAHAIFAEFLRQKTYLDDLLNAVELHQTQGQDRKKTVCFTGKMPQKRAYYEQLAQRNDYAVADDVSANLSLLVTADADANSTKAQKAAKYGVAIQSLTDWLANLPHPAEPENAADAPEQLTLF